MAVHNICFLYTMATIRIRTKHTNRLLPGVIATLVAALAMAYSSSGQHDLGQGTPNAGGLAQNGGSPGGAGSGSQDNSQDNSQGGGVGGLASNGGAGGFG